MTLYRKHRPKLFEDVVGQEYVIKTLSRAVDTGSIPHAYIFSGPRGTGKTTTARIFAKALNCIEGPTSKPCEKCPSCVSSNENASPDVWEQDAASQRGIDGIRELQDEIQFAPTYRYRVFILDEAHQLTGPASSAFLKTLEEPQPHAVFILATTHAQLLLPTIRSRCQQHSFRRIGAVEMAKELMRIAEKEKIHLEESAAMIMARESQGALRDALVSLEHAAVLASGSIGAEDVEALFGKVKEDMLEAVLAKTLEGNVSGCMEALSEIMVRGADPHQAAGELMSFARDVMLAGISVSPELMEATKERHEKLKALAERFDGKKTILFVEKLSGALREMKTAEYPTAVLEQAVLNIAVSGDVRGQKVGVESADLEAITARVDKMAKYLTSNSKYIERLRKSFENRGMEKSDLGQEPEADDEYENMPGSKSSVEEEGSDEAEGAVYYEEDGAGEIKTDLLERIKNSWEIIANKISGDKPSIKGLKSILSPEELNEDVLTVYCSNPGTIKVIGDLGRNMEAAIFEILNKKLKVKLLATEEPSVEDDREVPTFAETPKKEHTKEKGEGRIKKERAARDDKGDPALQEKEKSPDKRRKPPVGPHGVHGEPESRLGLFELEFDARVVKIEPAMPDVIDGEDI